MTTQEILALQTTKTEKIKLLLASGLTRKEVAQLLGIGYGFVQNVYAKVYGVANPRDGMAFRFDRSFGVEIEAIGASIAQVESAIRAAGVPCYAEGYNHTTRNHWKVVTDASVPGGFEVVSPVLKGTGGLAQLEKVCAALQQVGARINRQCGLHIHLGTGDFGEDPQVWKRLYRNYARLEDEIDSLMPASRRAQNNRFCQSLRVADFEGRIANATSLREIERTITGHSRYFKLNSQSFWRHKTVEFRQHSGTIEYEKIANWIEFCARFVAYAKQGKDAEGGFASLKQFLSKRLMDYYTSRRLQLAA
jgi:hypothetical protein